MLIYCCIKCSFLMSLYLVELFHSDFKATTYFAAIDNLKPTKLVFLGNARAKEQKYFVLEREAHVQFKCCLYYFQRLQ